MGIITKNEIFAASFKNLFETYQFKKTDVSVIEEADFLDAKQIDVLVCDTQGDNIKSVFQKYKKYAAKMEYVENIFLINEPQLDFVGMNFFLLKPFKFQDLVEILDVVIEKIYKRHVSDLKWGYLSYVVSDRMLIYKNIYKVFLTEKESDIVKTLFKKKTNGFTKEDMMSKVWKLSDILESHTFETHLYRLRKKIRERLSLEDLIINKDGKYFLNFKLIRAKNDRT